MEKFWEATAGIIVGILARLVALISESDKKKVLKKRIWANVLVAVFLSAMTLLLAWGHGGINIFLIIFACGAISFGGMELVKFISPAVKGVFKNALILFLKNILASFTGGNTSGSEQPKEGEDK